MRSRRVFASTTLVLFSASATIAACANDEPAGLVLDAVDADADVDAAPPATHDATGADVADLADADASADADADVFVPPNYDASDEPVTCSTQPCTTQLAAGSDFFCALRSDHSVYCWGYGARGSLGAGTELEGGVANVFPPSKVVDLPNATQISAAEYTACARTEAGAVKCWGNNLYGQLGLATTNPALTDRAAHPTPSVVALDVRVERVDVGERTICAVAEGSRDLHCWGANDQRQVARSSVLQIDGGPPTAGPGPADRQGHTIMRTGGGLASVFGSTTTGELVGWGSVSGRAASISPTAIMAPLPSLRGVTSFAAGPSHACAIAQGRLHCWGTNTKGVLGTGIPDSESLPAPIPLADTKGAYPQQIDVSANASCVRMTDGTLQCAGDDSVGQLGRGDAGTIAPLFGPVTVLQRPAIQVVTSLRATCALVRGGEVFCWGGNDSGGLGRGTVDGDAHPTPVNVVFP